MLSRLTTEMLLTSSPTIIFLLSLFLTAPARAQSTVVTPLSASTTVASAVPGRYLIVYRNGQIAADAASALETLGAHLALPHTLLGMAVAEDLTTAARIELLHNRNVEAIVPDLLMSAHTIKVQPLKLVKAAPIADALYHSPKGWAVRQVGGYGADGTLDAPVGPWNKTTGSGIRIAILDSGVDPNHPDIQPNLALNLSEVDLKALPSACDDGTPVDQTGHGTWTASLAAAALGPGTGSVVGVAPSATLLNIKVLQRMPGTASASDPSGCVHGQAAGLMSWVIQGIEDAITNRADIISMSFGTLVDVTTSEGAGEQIIFNRATAAAYKAGILVIAAMGNDAADLSSGQVLELPAQSRDVLAVVASTNPACAQNLGANAGCAAGPVTLAYYSNFGAPLSALAAPGGSYPVSGSSKPLLRPLAASGWVTGACSKGRPATVSGLPSEAGHSFGCFNLGHVRYVEAIGTSASAPLLAGAAALLMSAHPDWSPSTITQQLRSSAIITQNLATPQVTVAAALTPRL